MKSIRLALFFVVLKATVGVAQVKPEIEREPARRGTNGFDLFGVPFGVTFEGDVFFGCPGDYYRERDPFPPHSYLIRIRQNFHDKIQESFWEL